LIILTRMLETKIVREGVLRVSGGFIMRNAKRYMGGANEPEGIGAGIPDFD